MSGLKQERSKNRKEITEVCNQDIMSYIQLETNKIQHKGMCSKIIIVNFFMTAN